MSFLKNKSEFNLAAAKVLIENNLYAPSVHCSYYSVFQKLKYKYISKMNLSYDDLSQRITNDYRNTHTYIIDEFCNFIQDDRFKKRELKNKIKELKTFRNQSDYEDLEIDFDKSNSALSKSKEIIKEINKV